MTAKSLITSRAFQGSVAIITAIVVTAVYVWPAPEVHAAFPTNTSILDTFNRANGAINGSTSSSGTTWGSSCFGSGCVNMTIVSNQATSSTAAYGSAALTPTYGPDTESYATVNTFGVGSGTEIFGLGARMQNVGLSTVSGYMLEVYNGGAVNFRRWNNSTTEILLGTANVSAIGQSLTTGSSLGLTVTGTTSPVLTAWFKPPAGSWQSFATATDNFSITPPASNTPYRGSGQIAMEINSTLPRLDDFSGGTIITQNAPAAPTLSAPISGDGATSTAPRFDLRSTDAEGDYLRYKIEICGTSNCSSVLSTIDQTSSQTGWASQDLQSATAYDGDAIIGNSTMASYFYPTPPLTPNTQYWWRAYAIDPGGTNTFSVASTISTFTTAPTEVEIDGGTTITGGTKIAN